MEISQISKPTLTLAAASNIEKYETLGYIF